MKFLTRLFGFLFEAVMFLISLAVLAGFAISFMIALGDPFLGGRMPFWGLILAAGTLFALSLNPVVWRLCRGRLSTVAFLGLGLLLPIALVVAAAQTPYGLYLRTELEEEFGDATPAAAQSTPSPTISPTLRSAAQKGDPEAQLSLAQKLIRIEGASTEEGLSFLRSSAAAGNANAQALLAVLQMGHVFEWRQVLQRNDPEACHTMQALQSPPFLGQAIEPEWFEILEKGSRHRGWRRADEPGEPLNCSRASLNPRPDTFTFTNNAKITLPTRLAAFKTFSVEIECTVKTDFSLENCLIKSESPINNGAGEWGLREVSDYRVSPKDIYGYPMAGRRIVITLTPHPQQPADYNQ